MAIDFRKLKGKPVVDQTGTLIGRVSSVTLDTSPYAWTAVVVKVARPLRATLPVERRWLTASELTVPLAHVKAVGDQLLLSRSVDELATWLRDGGEDEEESEPGDDNAEESANPSEGDDPSI